jgi:prepilin signal peptidase PulO-like enzyme (type II secretory pathway)
MVERKFIPGACDSAAVHDPSKVSVYFGLFAAAYAVVAVPLFVSIRPDLLNLSITVLLGLALAGLSAIDVDCLRLPDALTLPLIAAGLGLTVLLGRRSRDMGCSGAWQLHTKK